MASPDGDIAAFLSGMPQVLTEGRREKPFVGMDECLNRQEIIQLTRELLQRGLIDCSSPLWYEMRERDGVITGSFLGGVDRDSSWRAPNPFIPDIGVPVKHRAWSDFRVAQMLVVQFVGGYDKVVLLSENTRNNVNGLRRLLKEVVGPALDRRPDGLSLTALFKKGKTNINDYCLAVFAYFERGQYPRGYREILL
ncbi:MAG: hypothetical protein AB7G75_37535 [Candidatus Binatia bacterium]